MSLHGTLMENQNKHQADDMVGRDQHEPMIKEMTIITGLDPEDDLHKLHTRVEIVIRMKAMVTINISTEADLANGTRGVIKDIILDHWEELERSELDSSVVTLIYPPAMTMFMLLESSFPQFEGLGKGEILIFPLEHNFQITTSTSKKVTIHHQQYTLTPRYAFMLR